MPYSLIPIGLAALLAYGFTFVLERVGLIRQALHRQIWNSVLLLCFFTTALLGILLAIQANYKFEMPIVDTLLVWHVDFGIALGFIAIFHFTWHWSYYVKIIRGGGRARDREEKPLSGSPPESPLKIPAADRLPLLSLGATALITQLILLREYLAIFHGNELVIGVILASWLLLTGTGALIGRNLTSGKLNRNPRPVIFYMLGLLPAITVTGIRFFKNIAFPLGSLSGIPGILLYSSAGMALFCLLAGFLFTRLSAGISSKYGINLVNHAYALESAGSIAAGILFSFLLVYFLNTYQILLLVFLLNLLTAFVSSPEGKRPGWLIFWGLSLLSLAMLVFWYDIDLKSRAFLYRNQEIVYTRDTPYGNLVVGRAMGQYTLYENTTPLAVSEDIASLEEHVHYAMIQHPGPEKVLVFSGNLSGLMQEISKYRVTKVDFIELNPWISRITPRYIPGPPYPWLNIINRDGRRYLGETQEKYDVVLMNLPAPSSAMINRFYTEEFFRQVKAHLNPGGILSVPLQGAENYAGGEAAAVYGIIYRTLACHFQNILIIPGFETYFLASDTPLDPDIPARIDARGVENVYVNRYYLDPQTIYERSARIAELIPASGKINRDFRPLAFLQQIRYWLSYFRSNLWVSLGLFLLLILLLGFRAGPLGTGLFVAGFTGMGIELVVLLAIQVIFGYIYQYTAVVLTVFMCGLAIGAGSLRRILPSRDHRTFMRLQIMLAGSVFLMFWLLTLLENYSLPRALLHPLFLSLTFLVSFLTGLLFGLAALLQRKGIARTAGGLYSADLAGSAAGALLVVILMIPLAGLSGTLLILLLLNLLAFLNSLLRTGQLRNS